MDTLATALPTLANSHPNPRYLVAIAGAPGSGKTTLATAIAAQINAASAVQHSTYPSTANGSTNGPSAKNKKHKATVLSMDGFHLPRSTLDSLPEPKRTEAYVRRGAPWTFDVKAFVAFMRRLRAWADSSSSSPSEEKEIYAPTFDHATKDPVSNGLRVSNDTTILIIEGNYLLLDQDEWRDVAGLVDYRVFVDVDLAEARERLARRHVAAGIEKSLEDGFNRVDKNDYLNGKLVGERLVGGVDVVVKSEREAKDLKV